MVFFNLLPPSDLNSLNWRICAALLLVLELQASVRLMENTKVKKELEQLHMDLNTLLGLTLTSYQ